jgi:hypothetical protein
MFNLGTKTVVLNSNANVTEANGVISIAGFGTLQSQQLLRQEDKGISVAKMQWQVCTQSIGYTLTILKRTIVLGIRSEGIV